MASTLERIRNLYLGVPDAEGETTLNYGIYLQQIRDAILGVTNTQYGSLNTNIYLQQIRNAILGVPDGEFGNLNSAIYLQQIRNAINGVPDGQFGSLDEGIYWGEILDAVLAGGGASDTTAPTVAITSTESSPTATSPVPITITFSEDVTGFEVGDITAAIPGGTVTKSNFVEVSGAVYTCDLAPSVSGTMTVGVAAEVAQDASENLNTAATQFTIAVIVFLLLDVFTTDDAAPLANPSTAEPGPGTWTVVNTNNALAKSSGKLTVAGNLTAASGNGLISQTGLSRVDGLTAMTAFDTFLDGAPVIGFALGSALGIINLGVYRTDSQSLASRHNNIIQYAPSGITVADYSSYAAVVFSTGSAIFGYNGSVWKLLFIESITTTATVYPQINNHVDSTANYSLNGFGAAILDIDRASISTDSKASANAGDTITHPVDGIVEATHLFAAGETYELSFRRTDDDNRWILRGVHDTDTFTLVERNAGTETVRATNSAMNITASGVARFFIRFTGNTIICGFEGNSTSGSLFEYASAFNNTATGAKVSHASAQFNSYDTNIDASISAQLNAMLAQVNF